MKYFNSFYQKLLKAEQIIDRVLDVNSISFEDMISFSGKGEQRFVDAKHEAAYLLSKYTDFREHDIACLLGYTNRASVCVAKKKIKNLCDVDKNYRSKIEEFNRLSELF